MNYDPTTHKDLLNPDYVAWRRFLGEADSWSGDRLGAHQLGEVKRIVAHAFEHTPGYRRLYEAHGLEPASLNTLDDLRRFPCVEKEMIRDRLEDFSVALAARVYMTTGGSTGIPFGFYWDGAAFAKELASKAHQYGRVGWKEGDRQIVFRGLPIETADHTRFVPEFNELRCSSYYLTPESMEVYRQRAWDYRPRWVRCYPSSGALFARWLWETGRTFPPIQGVFCASENLYDYQKELLRRVFGARVFAHYGHYELAVLAGFCEKEDTYHVLPHYGYAELLDPQGRPVTEPGQSGEIVATSFLMHATPFVRYRTRDLAVFKARECPGCGRPYQVWEKIQGRLQEFLVTGDGRHISMTAVNFHDDIFDEVKQFQFYQDRPGQLVVRYIPKPSFEAKALTKMGQRLALKLGGDMRLTFEKVADIPPTNRGKHRFLIQKLPIAFHDM